MTWLAGVAASGALFAAAAILSACGSDNPPPAGSSGTVADGGGPADSAPGLPNANGKLCVALDRGKTVAELGENMDVPPPLGGAIKPGTYLLDGLYVYGPIDAGPDAGPEVPNEALTGKSASGTLVVTSSTLAFLQAYGPTESLGAAAATGFAYTAADTTISAAQVCPSTEPTRSIPYSAVGDSLALFVEPKRRVVFRRKPEP